VIVMAWALHIRLKGMASCKVASPEALGSSL
jgi:hypothetical protein